MSLQRVVGFALVVLFHGVGEAPQTLNMIERLSAEPIQQKQGLRENHSTTARDED